MAASQIESTNDVGVVTQSQRAADAGEARRVELADVLAGGPVGAIFLDAGGVLILPHHGELSAVLERHGVRLDDALLDYAHYVAMASLDEASIAAGDWCWPVYLRDYVTAAGARGEVLQAAIDALQEALASMTLWSRAIVDSVAVLPRLSALGRPIVVVSNSDGSVERLLSAAGVCQVGPGRATPIAGIVDSDVVGFAKPDPRIFESALVKAGTSSAEAIHVGDSRFADLAGAEAAGIRGIHFDPYACCPDASHAHLTTLRELLPLLA